jgi:hypothetical protein
VTFIFPVGGWQASPLPSPPLPSPPLTLHTLFPPAVIQRYHSNEDLLQAAGEAVTIAVESAGVAYRGMSCAALPALRTEA